MKKILILLILLSLLHSEAIAQYELNNDDSVKMELIISILGQKELLIHRTKDDIPDEITRWITNEVKDFTIADFYGDFNKTDEIGNNLPMRRISFMSSYNGTWIITYGHGGIGFHHHINFFKLRACQKIQI